MTGTKIEALLRLTRWREHLPFVVPLTLVGALLATQLNNIPLDWRLLYVVIANMLAMSSAFIINDIEDAEADALEANKRTRNVISSGKVSRESAIIVARLTFVFSLCLYAFSGLWAFILGGFGLLSAYMYSVEPFRFKARPVVDVVIHALGGGSLQVMLGYFLYHHHPGEAWFVILAMASGAAYGQLYNQLDDYEVDKAVGLQNSTIVIGKTAATILMYVFIGMAGIGLLIAILIGTFPAWLGTVVVVCAVTCMMFVWKTDMRGTPTDHYGALQVPVLLTINMATMLWLAWALGFMTTGTP